MEPIDMSPALLGLRLGSKLHFSNLEWLRIKVNIADKAGFSYFLGAIPGLKILSLKELGMENSETLQLLSRQENLKSTLEVLEIVETKPGTNVGAGELLLRVLQEYRALRELYLDYVVISVDEILEILEGTGVNNYTFGCQELKVFGVRIYGHGYWASPSVLRNSYGYNVVRPSDTNYVNLSNLSQECTRLRYFKAPLIHLGNIETILLILRRNPDIEDLYLCSDLSGEPLEFVMEIIQIVLGLEKLTRLTLFNFTVKLGTLRSILYHHPQLENLYLEEYHELTPLDQVSSVDIDLLSNSMTENSLHPQQLSVPKQLRSLWVAESELTLEDTLLIIQDAPLLSGLYLWDYGSSTLSIYKDGLICILNSTPNLKCLEFRRVWQRTHGPEENFDFFEVLMGQGNLKETLEEYIVKEAYKSLRPANVVLSMLQECCALRRLCLGSFVIQLDGVLEILDSEGFDFGCQDMEVLEVTITGEGNWAPPEVLKERYDHDIEESSDIKYEKYDSLVRHLRRMPKLDLDTITFE
ncbi:hypothetical protein BGZ76_010953 [Entomortierella beljakovae]|nr:hypothetical protein BGZ76_010953 [Entomortierella beljakovae]